MLSSRKDDHLIITSNFINSYTITIGHNDYLPALRKLWRNKFNLHYILRKNAFKIKSWKRWFTSKLILDVCRYWARVRCTSSIDRCLHNMSMALPCKYTFRTGPSNTGGKLHVVCTRWPCKVKSSGARCSLGAPHLSAWPAQQDCRQIPRRHSASHKKSWRKMAQNNLQVSLQRTSCLNSKINDMSEFDKSACMYVWFTKHTSFQLTYNEHD